MTDKHANKLLAYSLYPLALGIFVSVSVIPIYHILTVSAFLLFLHHKQIKLKELPPSAWALIAFVVAQLISVFVNFTAMQETTKSLGTLKYPLFGVIGLLLFRSEAIQNNEYLRKHAKNSLNLFLFTIVAAFFFSAFKIYSGLAIFNDYYQALADGKENTRFRGFTEIMRYGYGSALVLLTLLACLLNNKKERITKSSFFTVAFFIGFVGMYLSYTRGSLLTFLMGVPIVVYFFNKRLSLIATSLSILIVGFMIAVSLMGGSSNSRLLQKSDSNSNRQRKSQYLAAAYAFKESPVFGYGPLQLKFHIQEIKEKHNLEYKDFISHAHNIYLQIAADSGILGLLAFLTWLLLWTKEILYKCNDFGKQMFLPSILFLLIAGQFEMLFMAQTSTLIFFIYALTQMNIFKKETV